MNIACIAYLEGAGGAEKQIIKLANAMCDKAHRVSLVVIGTNNPVFQVSENVNVIDCTKEEKKYANKIIGRYKVLRQTLNSIKPDISINFWLQSTYLLSLMPEKIRGKIIYSERGDPGDDEYSGLLGFIRKIAFMRVAGFVFQSEGARDYFRSLKNKKIVVIHNSVNIDEELYNNPCNARVKKIVNVGRLHHQKNQKILIEAFSLISERFKDYTLEIYGDGELKDELMHQITEHKLEKRIQILPSRKDIYSCMYNASLFVLSSDFEGMPNVLMEAMALGIPCISTDCRPGGARTLIEDGVNGWIVPIKDPIALSNKIIEVLTMDENKINNVVNAAIKIQDSHSDKTIYQKWESFLELMNNKKAICK